MLSVVPCLHLNNVSSLSYQSTLSYVKHILCELHSHALLQFLPCFCLKPEVPQDPAEAARLQQLQAAAAQWQQVQQQRAGLQYQALMQQHEKLQQILEQYQQLIKQPADLQVGKL